MTRRSGFTRVGIVVAAAILAALLGVPWLESARVQSPDGEFTAVTRGQLYRMFLPTMPGQGSDKPVQVTVYRGSRSCGTARVEIGWMARDDFRWELDARPRRASVRLVAEWDLDACTVRILQ